MRYRDAWFWPPSQLGRLLLRLGKVLVPLCILLIALPVVRADGIPPWLPHYDMDIHLDVAGHCATVRERVTWINRHNCPATELVFNAHSHYKIPDSEVGFLAKMAEIMRISPSEAMDFGGPPCEIQGVTMLTPSATEEAIKKNAAKDDKKPAPAPVLVSGGELEFHFQKENVTALVVTLPHPVMPGEAVTVEVAFTMRLPQKMGRWGQWRGVTYLSNWMPVLAFFDEKGWQPTPFIPWHQPWFNEAGVYNVHVELPCEQNVACTGTIVSEDDLGNGWKQVNIFCAAVRDFAFLCSKDYQEYKGIADGVTVRVMALKGHEHYAKVILRIVCEAIPVYAKWFGPYPNPEFTIAESYFGWNGNECGGLVMIDSRIFGMPHLAEEYVDYLVSHEVCHQWFYNVIGTNGYCETFMDEAFAVYFSHRLLNYKCGKNNPLLKYPLALQWLPTINRENYRWYGMYGTIGRGEMGPTVQEMPKFGHVVNLFSMAYDKGSKLVGMIEDRLGEEAFIDFMRGIYTKYYFRIIRVEDFQHELEAYTGQSWEQFFHDWMYGSGMTDWCVQKVTIAPIDSGGQKIEGCCWRRLIGRKSGAQRYEVTVLLHQKAELNEPTVLGFRFGDNEGYQVRLPIVPQVEHMDIDEPPAKIDSLPGNCVRVVVELPCEPSQIAVDPDHVLVDRDPSNNYWIPRCRFRVTPLYTFLEETDLTNDYDRWNFIFGPWLYYPAYDDPWFTRSTMYGIRADAYRTQFFDGGVFAAYRTDFRDIIVGADGVWDHTPFPNTQIGFTLERRLSSIFEGADEHANRGVLFGRYVFGYGDSLYLPPMHYAEVYASAQDNFLPVPNQTAPGAERYHDLSTLGLHYHIDYLTPYWDPEGGFKLDATYGGGCVNTDKYHTYQEMTAQFSMVKGLPEWLGPLSETHVAMRAYGAIAQPKNVEFFPLGGENLFRGFTIADRQGNAVWLGSVEWRVPFAKGLTYDCCDHVIGLRNVYGAAFYDVGQAYVNGHGIGSTANAVGGGVRLDVAWFGMIERSILRLDVAKTIDSSTPWQVWLGVQQPF